MQNLLSASLLNNNELALLAALLLIMIAILFIVGLFYRHKVDTLQQNLEDADLYFREYKAKVDSSNKIQIPTVVELEQGLSMCFPYTYVGDSGDIYKVRLSAPAKKGIKEVLATNLQKWIALNMAPIQ